MVNTTIQIEKLAYVPATKVHDAVDLTVSGGATPNATSTAIDVAGARLLTVSVLNGKSTDLDVIVYGSYDGTTFDTIAYASMNVGADTNKTLPITPGPSKIKVKIVNNDAGNASTVTVGLNLTY